MTGLFSLIFHESQYVSIMASEKSEEDKNGEETVTKPQRSKKAKCCRCLFWTFSVLTALLAILAGLSWQLFLGWNGDVPVDIIESIGHSGIQLFFQHDRDGDGYLSLREYETLYLLLKEGGRKNFTQDVIYDQPFEEGAEVITVTAKFKPLLQETMTREKSFAQWGLDPLSGLKKWQTLNHVEMNFAVQHFEAFMPSPFHIEHPGELYALVGGQDSFMERLRGDLSSNRYYPPRVEEKDIILHRLLSMFHPRPFLLMRFGPRGSLACVRAYNDEYLDIAFRIHAEFQLNEAPYHPFWFTPAQFTGNLIVSRDFDRILSFNLFVPADKKLNVDMEWLEGPESMVVDIGYMPEMSLQTTGPSAIPTGDPREHKVPNSPASIDEIKWIHEIPQEEALRILEVSFYPFKQVKYYNFTEAVTVAGQENKLIHCVLLWGALDDQSC